MARTRKIRDIKKNRKIRKIKKIMGGALENNGLPQCTILSQFQITDDNITNFNRTIQAPMDCFINALQIMNILDDKSANIMRISTLGKSGFTKEQIEIIFIYTVGTNFDFKSTNNFIEWATWIKTLLNPGNVVFAGYTGHVFLIGRLLNGTLIYIDPQVNQLCNLEDPECQQYVQAGQDTWFLLFNSQERLTPDQQHLVVAYTNYLQTSSL
jgi:hypothetical protein